MIVTVWVPVIQVPVIQMPVDHMPGELLSHGALFVA